MFILWPALSSVVKTKNLFASIWFRNNCIMNVDDKSVYLNWAFPFITHVISPQSLFTKTCRVMVINIDIDC